MQAVGAAQHRISKVPADFRDLVDLGGNRLAGFARPVEASWPDVGVERQLRRTAAGGNKPVAESTVRSNNLLDSSSRCDSLLKRLLRYQIDTLALGLGNNSQPLVKLGRDA